MYFFLAINQNNFKQQIRSFVYNWLILQSLTRHKNFFIHD